MYTRKGAGGPPRLMDCEEKPKRKTSSLCLQHQTGARRPGQAPGQRPGSVKAAAGIAQFTPPARNPDSSAGDLQMRARFLLLAAGGGGDARASLWASCYFYVSVSPLNWHAISPSAPVRVWALRVTPLETDHLSHVS